MMPRFRAYQGCGAPPTATCDNPDERVFWSYTETPEGDRAMSPHQRHELGLPAIQFGITEDHLIDWEWCPRWWLRFAEPTVNGGRDGYSELIRAYNWREKGQLHLYLKDPTPCAVEGIDLIGACIQEQWRANEVRRKANKGQG